MRVLRQQTVTELRSSIDRLPERTRAAMLTGVQAGTMITGAYADRDGGVCPMLAAHRQGARADFVAFAGAWDRFTGVEGWDICRRATPAEVGLLVAQLQESLADVGSRSDLSAAIAEHQRLTRTRHDRVPRADLAGAIADHQALARTRREREAAGTGRDWLRGGDVAPAWPPARRTRRTPALA